MILNQYFKQAKLLIKLLPFLAGESKFALKGGTAINFFVRNFPRLSVDIDITDLPINERTTALHEISLMLLRYSSYVHQIYPHCKITSNKLKGSELLKG